MFWTVMQCTSIIYCRELFACGACITLHCICEFVLADVVLHNLLVAIIKSTSEQSDGLLSYLP